MTPLATQTLALGPEWLDPTVILDWLGPWALVGVAAIIFAECGLLLGFFLPGDSLLFTAGLFVATGQIDIPLWLMCTVLVVSAFAGNAVGYGIGYRAGPAVFDKPKSKLFNPAHVQKTHEFFDKYGNRAIVLGRFVPIVRTFITVSAGVARMDPRRYLTYSLIGGVAWAAGVTVLGYFLGRFTFVRDHIDLILVLVVAVSLVPIAVELLRSRRKGGGGAPASAAADVPPGGSPSDLTQPISLPRDAAPRHDAAPRRETGPRHDTASRHDTAPGGTGAAPEAPGPEGHRGVPGSGSPDATETTWITPVGQQPAPGAGPAPRDATPARPEGARGLPSHGRAPVESRSTGRPVMGYPSPSRRTGSPEDPR